MGTTYLGLAFSASMLPSGFVEMVKNDLTLDEVHKAIEAGVEVCFNPSHQATISALGEKHGISVEIPERPPRISLESGDSIIVLQVRGLPRLTDRHEYTPEEIAAATFSFIKIAVEGVARKHRLSPHDLRQEVAVLLRGVWDHPGPPSAHELWAVDEAATTFERGDSPLVVLSRELAGEVKVFLEANWAPEYEGLLEALEEALG